MSAIATSNFTLATFTTENEEGLGHHYQEMCRNNPNSATVDTVHILGLGQVILFSDCAARQAYSNYCGLAATGEISVEIEGQEVFIPWGMK